MEGFCVIGRLVIVVLLSVAIFWADNEGFLRSHRVWRLLDGF